MRDVVVEECRWRGGEGRDSELPIVVCIVYFVTWGCCFAGDVTRYR